MDLNPKLEELTVKITKIQGLTGLIVNQYQCHFPVQESTTAYTDRYELTLGQHTYQMDKTGKITCTHS